MKKKIILVIAIIAALALGFGAGQILAAGTEGTQTDPLITLAYLNEKFAPQLMQELESKLQDAEDALAARVDAQLGDAVPGEASGGFALVTLTAGQTLTAADGVELLLRSGAAEVGTLAVADTSAGTSAEPGTALAPNHMYLLPAGSVVAAAADCTALVRGSYAVA